MNIKRFVLAVLAVFVTLQVTDFLVHSVILGSTYESLEGVWRSDMMSKMWVMTLASLFLSHMFVFIFAKGYEGKGIIEGVRFGLIIGLLMTVVGMLSQYAVYPIPFSLTIKWIVFGLLQFVIAGIVASLIYKPTSNN